MFVGSLPTKQICHSLPPIETIEVRGGSSEDGVFVILIYHIFPSYTLALRCQEGCHCAFFLFLIVQVDVQKGRHGDGYSRVETV